MSAELLREAAAKMRERARAFLNDNADERWTPMPTIDPDNNGWVVAYDLPEADWDTTVAQLPYDYEGNAAPHIASWHPAVALAVADWLDAEAAIEERTRLAVTFDGAPMFAASHPAVSVARAYLGEAS